MKKQVDKKINFIIIFYFLIIVLLIFLFPLLGDDLLHGSIGNSFAFMPHVNGRYLGNFFGINLSANLVLRVIIKSLVILLIIFMSKKILEIKNNRYILFFIILFMLMPKEMFRETIPFNSGFANYVIPIVGVLYIINAHLNNTQNKSNCFKLIMFLLLGVFNSLFVEHVTIFNLILSIYIIIYDIKKYKKINYNYLLYFIGSLIGTIIMFSNPTYLVAFKGDDVYRSFSSFRELLYKPWAVLRASFFKNYIFNIVLILILLKLYKEKTDKNSLDKFLFVYLIFFGLYTLLKLFHLIPENIFIKMFEVILILTLIFTVYYVLKNLRILSDREKYRLIFYFLCMLFILAPLVVVSPLGARCYVMVYVLLIIFMLNLLIILEKNKLINIKKLSKYLIVLATLQIILYLNIYYKIYEENLVMVKSIEEAKNNDNSIIKLEKFSNPEFIHGDLCSKYVQETIRIYYQIPSTITFEIECHKKEPI